MLFIFQNDSGITQITNNYANVWIDRSRGKPLVKNLSEVCQEFHLIIDLIILFLWSEICLSKLCGISYWYLTRMAYFYKSAYIHFAWI